MKKRVVDKNIVIIEYQDSYQESIKNLLVELQNYIIKIDKYNLNIISKDYRDKYFDFMLEDNKRYKGKVFLAVQDNCVLGFISGYLRNYDFRDYLDYSCPKMGIITEFIVNQDSQSQGVGKKLLFQMEDYLKNLDCQYITLDVFAYNQKAIDFYYGNNYENRMISLIKKV